MRDRYRALTDEASVHLADFPEPEGHSEPELEQAMDDVRRLVALGRAAREKAGVRIRQPLRTPLEVGTRPTYYDSGLSLAAGLDADQRPALEPWIGLDSVRLPGAVPHLASVRQRITVLPATAPGRCNRACRGPCRYESYRACTWCRA